MARNSRIAGSSRFRLGRSERSAGAIYANKIPGDFERKCFEFDRKLVVGVLETLRAAINEGAIHMAMVADERVFNDSISGTFSRNVRRLNRMASRLEKLLSDVGDASGYPKLPIASSVARAVVLRLPTRT